MPDLVENTAQIVRSLDTFNNEASQYPATAAKTLTLTTFWVFDPTTSRFGPSKFVGYQGMNFANYEAEMAIRENKYFDGHDTRVRIEKVARSKYQPDDGLASQLIAWGVGLTGSEKVFDGVDRQKWRFLSLSPVTRKPEGMTSASFEPEPVPDTGSLRLGGVYQRADLHQRFGGNRTAGIVVSTREKVILLFHTEEPAQQFYRDGFDATGVYWYSGEGTLGDMRWTHANRSIRDHVSLGYDLLLFERVQRQGGFWRFAQQLEFATFRQEHRPDKRGQERVAIIFGLQAPSRMPVPTSKNYDGLNIYRPEFAGTAIVKQKTSESEATWVHGAVINTLADRLAACGLAPKNSRFVDLCLTDDSGAITVLFEAKTDADPYSIYTGIGQLMYHTANEKSALKILVLPRVSRAALERLAGLDIRVLTFSHADGKVCFENGLLEAITADARRGSTREGHGGIG